MTARASRRYSKRRPPVVKAVSKVTRYEGVIPLAELKVRFNLPNQARITVEIPGGGDWSGMEVAIGEEIPHLKVAWEETVTEPPTEG